jgi:hypothetical protein
VADSTFCSVTYVGGSPPQYSLYLARNGTCTVTASNAGDARYAAFSVTASMFVSLDVSVNLPKLVRLGNTASADFSFEIANPFPGNLICLVDIGTHAPGMWVQGVGGIVDNHALCTVQWQYASPGIYNINAVMGCAVGSAQRGGQLIAFDPNGRVSAYGAFVSPPGAFLRNPPLGGVFTFVVSSSYEPGADFPTGQVVFELVGGSIPIRFHATGQYVLLVTGPNAMLRGWGVDHNNEDFFFEIKFTQGPPDMVRVTAWDINGNLVYDTQGGVGYGDAPTTPLGAGSVTVSH